MGGSAPFGNEHQIQQQQHQIHAFQHQQQQLYGKSQAALIHSQQQQQRGAPQTHTILPHPPQPPAGPSGVAGGGGVEPNQNQQMMERQQREANSETTKSGLSISAMPFVPTSSTPPTARKFNSSATGVGEGIPPPPHSVSAVPIGVGGSHVTRPNAPLLQHVVLPAGHHNVMVPTPPPPPPPSGMLPIPRPRPHTQQMHIGNPAQFQHPRKTSASSAVAQGQSLLGGPAYQVIDKPHHPAGTVSRQLSGGDGSGGASKPPPGLSLPIRPNMISDQGSTPTPGVLLSGLDLQAARTMAMNRSGHALVSTTPLTAAGAGYPSVRPQHPPHQIHELSLYGAPPAKMQSSVTTGSNKRALLPTPTAATPIHAAAQLGFLTGGSGAHHIAVAPSASLPPGVQSWSGGNMRMPPSHRVPPPPPPPPPSVTNQNSHRQHQVIYTQEQVVQRSNYSGGYASGRGGNGGGM